MPVIKKMSAKFFAYYSRQQFPEIEQDPVRPYLVLVLSLNKNTFICSPFRSHINHTNGYLFKSSKRSIDNKSGIDYSKTVIIRDTEYLDHDHVIDQDEYKETITNIKRIESSLAKYITEYVNHHRKTSLLHPREYARKYRYTTLKYFHKELGII